ncbi:MAG: hypothetical protein N0A16_13405 [Blastocatellia bacterium]|nr:hypothetical protein [Blastocatellia bacterium]MDW8110214.1 CARDB domain-containing protein [Candidatus Bipolaricaulota bacterium]
MRIRLMAMTVKLSFAVMGLLGILEAVAWAVDPPSEPVPTLDLDDPTKSIVVLLDFEGRDRVSLRVAKVVRNRPHGRVGDPPLLGIRLLDRGGRVLQEFNAWHPLWAFVGGEGSGEFFSEQRIILPRATGRFVLPFSLDFKTMEVVDKALNNRLLISVDLEPAILLFCQQNPTDPDCQAKPSQQLPDLTVSLGGPSAARPGEEIGTRLEIKVRNIGGAPAPGTNEARERGYMVDIVLSTDEVVPPGFATFSPNFAEDVLLRGGRISRTPTLGPGESATVSEGEMFIPADTPPGRYCLIAVVDSGLVVPESNEANNTTCHSIEITKEGEPPPSPPPAPPPAGGFIACAAGADGAIDDLEMLSIIDAWIKQKSYQNCGVPSDLDIMETLDRWIKGIKSAAAFAPLQIRTIALSQNPVRTSAARFAIEGSGIAQTSVQVFALNGRLVFAKSELGRTVSFDRARELPNGVYLYVVHVRGYDGREYVSAVRKLIILR